MSSRSTRSRAAKRGSGLADIPSPKRSRSTPNGFKEEEAPADRPTEAIQSSIGQNHFVESTNDVKYGKKQSPAPSIYQSLIPASPEAESRKAVNGEEHISHISIGVLEGSNIDTELLAIEAQNASSRENSAVPKHFPNPILSSATKEDKLKWEGFCEIESDPVSCINNFACS